MNGNTGHGHVWSRPDGMRARCGGPAICAQCAQDYYLYTKQYGPNKTAGDLEYESWTYERVGGAGNDGKRQSVSSAASVTIDGRQSPTHQTIEGTTYVREEQLKGYRIE